MPLPHSETDLLSKGGDVDTKELGTEHKAEEEFEKMGEDSFDAETSTVCSSEGSFARTGGTNLATTSDDLKIRDGRARTPGGLNPQQQPSSSPPLVKSSPGTLASRIQRNRKRPQGRKQRQREKSMGMCAILLLVRGVPAQELETPRSRDEMTAP